MVWPSPVLSPATDLMLSNPFAVLSPGEENFVILDRKIIDRLRRYTINRNI